MRSTIPALHSHFKPKIVNAQSFQLNRDTAAKQKTYHNKHTNNVPEGENVRMRDEKSWKPVRGSEEYWRTT